MKSMDTDILGVTELKEEGNGPDVLDKGAW